MTAGKKTVPTRVSSALQAVGLIHSADMADYVIASVEADLVVLGRTLLGDPYWPLQAAKRLRTNIRWPYQYERGDIF